MNKAHPAWFVLIAALIALLVWLAFFWEPETTVGAGSASSPPTHAAIPADEMPAGGDFQLTSPSGPLALADLRGKVVALYFGYTSCPDVCPTALVLLSQGIAQLTPAEQEKVRVLFVTLDPERDTLDVLKVYVPHFHPSFTGLTGTPEEIARVARQYGVRYMKQKPDSNGLYAVDHSTFTYLIGADGKLVGNLAHGTSPQETAEKIRALIKP